MKQAIEKYLGASILAVLSFLVIQGLVMTLFSAYIVEWTFYVGATLIPILWILRFVNSRLFKYVIGLTLMFGAVNIIEFTYYHSTTVFSWTPPGKVYSSIGFQPLILLLLMVFIIGNLGRIMSRLGKLFSHTEEERRDSKQNVMQSYIVKLKQKSEMELRDIIDNRDQYQSEFVEAAQQLLASNNNHKIN